MIESTVARQGVLILDGGLATALEARGCDLDDPLWSARLLLEDPELIRSIHRDYLEAGADCIITASYQASIPGLMERGMDETAARKALERSVNLAVDARDEFWNDPANRTDRLRPLVAASVGPFGATLGDGSEFTGDYPIGEDELYDFHRERWQLLASSPADLLACETIPSSTEAAVLVRLLRETPQARAWISFSCRDGHHVSDGSSAAELIRACSAEDQIVALGINCTSPEFLPSLITIAASATSKPIVVYPNSGEVYDAGAKKWGRGPVLADWGVAAQRWHDLGARVIGGCCRVGPDEIRIMRNALVDGIAQAGPG